MDTTKVANAASNMAQAGMQKTGPEFYAFMAVCLILGCFGLFLWFQARSNFAKAKVLSETTQAAQASQQAAQQAPVAVTLDKATLKEILQPMVDNLELRINMRFEGLERVVEQNQEREEGRLAGIERKMEDGFRTIHDRLDRHIEADRPSSPQVGRAR